MSPNVTQLKDIRNEVRGREEKVEKAIDAERTNIADFRELIHGEQKEITKLRDRRVELGRELDAEITLDGEGSGERGKGWQR